MSKRVMPTLGKSVTRYTQRYGNRAGKDLVRLVTSWMKHSCDGGNCASRKRVKIRAGLDPNEAHDFYSEIANCPECRKKVNYCCKIHQIQIEGSRE